MTYRMQADGKRQVDTYVVFVVSGAKSFQLTRHHITGLRLHSRKRRRACTAEFLAERESQKVSE